MLFTCSLMNGFSKKLSTVGTQSATRSKPIGKADVPAFDWPAAKFPRYQYPLDLHQQHNKQEDQDCLKDVSPTELNRDQLF